MTGEILRLKVLIPADERGDHLVDLFRFEELAKTELACAGIVGNDGEVVDVRVTGNGTDEGLRGTAKTETSRKDGGAWGDILDGLVGGRVDF